MALEDEIRIAIDKNLSAEIGTRLLTRLQRAEDDSNALDGFRAKLQRAQDHITELEAKLARHKEIDERMATLVKREDEVNQKLMRAEIYELRVKCSEEKVGLMRDVVKDVFANHRFKYMVTEGGTMPVMASTGSYPSPQGFSRTATGEGEGAPPPPPSGSPGQG